MNVWHVHSLSTLVGTPVYFCVQLFPVKMDPRWPTPPSRPLALALQQVLAQEVLRARKGMGQQGGTAPRVLQALAAVFGSAHAGPLVVAMRHSHAFSCPLLRQLHLYQVGKKKLSVFLDLFYFI